jgi:transcriptional regulator GlxA family with amidase domain
MEREPFRRADADMSDEVAHGFNGAKRLTVGIFIFDDVEVLDFAGPFEVFSRTRTVAGAESRRTDDSAPFEVFTVARSREQMTAIGGLVVTPRYAWADAPPIDLLVVPGGFGTRALLGDEETLAWIRETAGRSRQVTSVCTGALLLAKAGLLQGRRATTHWAGLDLLASIDPTIAVQRDTRVVHDGIFTSAGVSAGIDMSFAVVEQICGRAVALETAHYIEYPWGNVGRGDVQKHQDAV